MTDVEIQIEHIAAVIATLIFIDTLDYSTDFCGQHPPRATKSNSWWNQCPILGETDIPDLPATDPTQSGSRQPTSRCIKAGWINERHWVIEHTRIWVESRMQANRITFQVPAGTGIIGSEVVVMQLGFCVIVLAGEPQIQSKVA